MNHKMVPETKTLFIFCLFTKQIARPLYSLAFLANCHHNHMFKAFFKNLFYIISRQQTLHTIPNSTFIVVEFVYGHWHFRSVNEESRGSIILGRFGGKAGSGNKERKNTGSCSSSRRSSNSSQQKQRSALLNVKKGSFTIL